MESVGIDELLERSQLSDWLPPSALIGLEDTDNELVVVDGHPLLLGRDVGGFEAFRVDAVVDWLADEVVRGLCERVGEDALAELTERDDFAGRLHRRHPLLAERFVVDGRVQHGLEAEIREVPTDIPRVEVPEPDVRVGHLVDDLHVLHPDLSGAALGTVDGDAVEIERRGGVDTRRSDVEYFVVALGL